MIKKLKKILVFLFILAASSTAYADSISTAIDIVEGFEKETGAVLNKFDPKETSVARKAATAESEKAVSELRAIGLTQNPGDSRYRRAFRIVDTFTGRLIDLVQGLDKKASPAAATRIRESVKRLTELKGKYMAALDEARKNEGAGRKDQQPVPLIDRSPFDSTPGEPPGMWYR